MTRMITLLKSKIHRATVTESDLHYEGSISVDTTLLEASGILPYEQVDVLNIQNGERFTTYTIEATKDSGKICVNGAAARLVQKGDLIIICAYQIVDDSTLDHYQPKVILVNDQNMMQPHV